METPKKITVKRGMQALLDKKNEMMRKAVIEANKFYNEQPNNNELRARTTT
jgi:hypothetical protein